MGRCWLERAGNASYRRITALRPIVLNVPGELGERLGGHAEPKRHQACLDHGFGISHLTRHPTGPPSPFAKEEISKWQ
jgi:hypothetical protein